jgi:tRNA pseudouridine38-40 synthase
VERRRYALRLLYDGRLFRGFQRQPGLPTVQEALEAGLSRLGVEATLEVAARTDAGVSALDQVVSFPTRADLDPVALRRAVNEAAPEGLTCLAAARAPASFNARASALGRRYVYLVGTPPPEAAAAMRAALAFAVGEHDFTGFARPGEQRGTVRTVTRADVVEAEPEAGALLAVVLEGRGFLRAMVRNLVGTAVAVGLERAPPEVVRELIVARGRYRGVRAPGWGLTLAAVSYPPGLLDWR